MIKTVNLQKVYTTEEVETTALNNVNIDIDQGEFVAIMGHRMRQIHTLERGRPAGQSDRAGNTF